MELQQPDKVGVFTRFPHGDPAVIDALGRSVAADLDEAMETTSGPATFRRAPGHYPSRTAATAEAA